MQVSVENALMPTAPGGVAPTDGPLRTCLASGEARPADSMIRFVVGPDGRLVPDLARKLPGRGLWVTARRELLARAIARKAFARAARKAVVVDPDLPERIERLLRERALEALALARRSGAAVNGFAKVEDRLRAGALGLVVCAAEAQASDGRAKLKARGAALADFVDAALLGRVFGRDDATYIGIAAGTLARRVAVEIGRWAAWQGATGVESVELGVRGLENG